MLVREDAKTLELPSAEGDMLRRRQFIERMERKLAQKAAARRRQREQFRARLVRTRSWQ